ncbi:MAG: hypothetical protein ACREP9_03895 [Candidatus Dormibacteraceae bacterium]
MTVRKILCSLFIASGSLALAGCGPSNVGPANPLPISPSTSTSVSSTSTASIAGKPLAESKVGAPGLTAGVPGHSGPATAIDGTWVMTVPGMGTVPIELPLKNAGGYDASFALTGDPVTVVNALKAQVKAHGYDITYAKTITPTATDPATDYQFVAVYSGPQGAAPNSITSVQVDVFNTPDRSEEKVNVSLVM